MTAYFEILSESLTHFQGEAGDNVDWGEIESAYRFEFPRDYKEFVKRFGAGTIEGSIATLVPVVTSDPMVRRVAHLPDAVREESAFRVWAEGDDARARGYGIDQILVWGETDSADVLGWIASRDDPDSWPVVVYSRSEAAWSVYFCGMVEFLAKLLMGCFEKCPISDTSLVGISKLRFLHDRDEERLAEEGVYPWSEE
ncbi:SMI1/KNR4 family protein [Streptomyces sp. NBC_00102]|uniref:SMI1/KNR4 family protein n=1 Tax=Streptomyces sp. NBC_00102 TaxID=2975652 RepID=UPI00224CD1EE|nr:SMI1/KNR4 family protein [Streptomyces sp. NBC_00102]MCX5401785.1 SMI1/KNR4 family protein [Streptomyces sp. NBC_00102]